jgi:predicted CopG family antitoxin
VYVKCMAVKTITIDLEAYEALAKRKKGNESFSQVIKRTFSEERYTAKHLLENLEEVSLSEETLDRIEEIRRQNELEYPEEIK